MTGFEEVIVQHSRRESNGVADALAKFATSPWFSSTQNPLPQSLEDLANRDIVIADPRGS